MSVNNQVQRNLHESRGSQSALRSPSHKSTCLPPARRPPAEPPGQRLPAQLPTSPKGPCEGHLVQACPRASAGVVTVSSYLRGAPVCVCVPPGKVGAAVNRTPQMGLKQTFTPPSAGETPGSGWVLGRPLPGSSSQPFWGCTR